MQLSLSMKESFATALANAPLTMSAGKYSGRGIVMCVGNSLLTSAYVNLHVLRNVVGCKLPIEIWYIDDKDLSLDNRAILHIAFPDTVFHTAPEVKGGWQLKPHAILNSAFEEVLLLDADNTPAVDPTFIFDWPEYKSSGAVFWSMIADVMFDDAIMEVCNPSIKRTTAFESGQVLVNKSMVFREIWLTDWINQNSDFFYQHLYGDKDTFALAWTACGRQYALAPPPTVFSQIYYQPTLDKKPLFQHRIAGKFDLYAIPRRLEPQFKNGVECIAAIHTLKSILSPTA